MAKQVKLAAQTRTGSGRTSVKKLKAQGIVPAIIYGGTEAPQNLQVGEREINTLLSHAVGESILVELEIDNEGTKSSRTALIQEIQHHPLSRKVLHVDFHAISMNETVRAEIPVEPTGDAVGVKSYGGILEQSLRSMEVECLPRDLPEIIMVDVSALNIGDSLHVKDVKLSEGVKAVEDEDLTVFLVSAPKVEEEPAAATAATSPEVIKEKKEDPAEKTEKK